MGHRSGNEEKVFKAKDVASFHWSIFSYKMYPCNHGIRQHKSVPSMIACLKSNQGYKMDL